MKNLNIVLLEPQIPQNTGNISRTCAVTGARLHLIKPLGFEVTDKNLKRAGLDYWDKLDITYYENLDDFLIRITENIFISQRREKMSIPMFLILITPIFFSEEKIRDYLKNFFLKIRKNACVFL